MVGWTEQDSQSNGADNRQHSEDSSVRTERQWANTGQAISSINANDKVIEEKERELVLCIAQNYNKLKDVEKELADVQLHLRLTSGPKKSALEHMRKKIEAQNENVMKARRSFQAASKIAEAAETALKAEEAAKDKLCQELNLLVQQSASAQLQRLQELSDKIEVLNRGFHSASDSSKALPRGSSGSLPTPGAASPPTDSAKHDSPSHVEPETLDASANQPLTAQAQSDQGEGNIVVNGLPGTASPLATEGAGISRASSSGPQHEKDPPPAVRKSAAAASQQGPSAPRRTSRPSGAGKLATVEARKARVPGKRNQVRATIEDLPRTEGPFAGFE